MTILSVSNNNNVCTPQLPPLPIEGKDKTSEEEEQQEKNYATNNHENPDDINKVNEIEQIFNQNFPPNKIFSSVLVLKDTAVSLGKIRIHPIYKRQEAT